MIYAGLAIYRELAKSSGDAAQVNKCNAKIKAFQSKYNEISEITGIAKDPKRMSVPKIEKNSQNNLTNSGNGGIIKTRLNSIADPMREVFGDGETSHPKEIAEFRKEAAKLGASIKEHENENLGYSPGLKQGKPGMLYISKGASYSAWCHEMQHMRDDFSAGWSGMRIMQDLDECYYREKRAYQVEIDLAKQANRPDIVERLKNNLEKERKNIYGEQPE